MYNSENTRAFQKELDIDKHRRIRQNARSNLRKQNREIQFREKRRAIRDTKGRVITENTNNSSLLQQQMLVMNQPQTIDAKLELLPQYVQGCIQSNHPGTQFECVQRIRQLLSVEGNALQLIGAVISTGVVPRLVQFLRYDKYDRLQFEAAWALTNIASGDAEHTAEVIKSSAIPLFVELVSSTKSIQVIEQAIWALGNIAGDSKECRSLVLDNHALDNIWALLNSQMMTDLNTYYNNTWRQQNNEQAQTQNDHTLSLLRNVTWTIGNFVRGNEAPDWPYVKIAMKSLVMILQMDVVNGDLEITRDACWAFSYLSDIEVNPQIFPLLLETGALRNVILFLGDYQSDIVRHPALRCVGNIVTGTDEYTQACVDLGVLPQLLKLLKLKDSNQLIKKETCWAVSNVTAGNKSQIEEVINCNIIPSLITILSSETFDIRKEAAWALSNITSGGSDHQIRYLVHVNVLPPFCRLFHEIINKFSIDHRVHKILMVLMEAMQNILLVGERMRESDIEKYKNDSGTAEDEESIEAKFPNAFAEKIEEAGGSQYLEDIQMHQELPTDLYLKAQQILKGFFNGEMCDDDDEVHVDLVGLGDNQQNGRFNPFAISHSGGSGEGNEGQEPVVNHFNQNLFDNNFSFSSFNNNNNGGNDQSTNDIFNF